MEKSSDEPEQAEPIAAAGSRSDAPLDVAVGQSLVQPLTAKGSRTDRRRSVRDPQPAPSSDEAAAASVAAEPAAPVRTAAPADGAGTLGAALDTTHKLLGESLASEVRRYARGDLTSEERIDHRLAAASEAVLAVGFTADEQGVCSVARNGLVRTWDRSTGAPVHRARALAGPLTTVMLAPAVARAVCLETAAVTVRDLAEGQLLYTLASPVRQGSATPAAGSVAGQGVESSGFSIEGNVIRALPGRQVLDPQAPSTQWRLGVTTVALTADGGRVVCGNLAGFLVVWDLMDGSVPRILEFLGGPIQALAITPDGRYAASSAGEGLLSISDLAQATAVSEFVGEYDWFDTLAISGDGQRDRSGLCGTPVPGCGAGRAERG